MVTASAPGAPRLARTSNHARRSTSLRWTRSNSAWNLRSGDRLAARYSLCCRARVLSRVLLATVAMHRLLPVKQAQTKQGPFAAAGYVVLAGDRYYDPLRRPPGSMRLPVRRLYAPAAPGPQARGRGGPLQFPPPPSVRSAPHYGGGFLGAAPSGSSRLPWPSPCYSGLGSPLSPHGAGLTPRQASLHAADRTVAPTNVAFDAGLRRRAFPPDAASLLPGSLTTTWTGLPPAGGDELADTHDLNHQGHRPPIRSRVPSGHAVARPAAHDLVEPDQHAGWILLRVPVGQGTDLCLQRPDRPVGDEGV